MIKEGSIIMSGPIEIKGFCTIHIFGAKLI